MKKLLEIIRNLDIKEMRRLLEFIKKRRVPDLVSNKNQFFFLRLEKKKAT